MDRYRAVVLALLLGSASAAEKTPAMVWTGAAPSGACKGSRVTLVAATGARWCCVTGAWAACDTAPAPAPAQTCTTAAATTCTITVARSGCTPVCGMGASAAGSTWVRADVATTTLTCTFSTSGTNICNCLCP